MITQFVEVTDGVAYGKFLVCRMDRAELSTPTAMPESHGELLLNYGGRRRFHDHTTLVIDLQIGSAFAWTLSDGAWRVKQYAAEHYPGYERYVCPMYTPFVEWLHEQQTWALGRGDITEIPRLLTFEPGLESRLIKQLLMEEPGDE